MRLAYQHDLAAHRCRIEGAFIQKFGVGEVGDGTGNAREVDPQDTIRIGAQLLPEEDIVRRGLGSRGELPEHRGGEAGKPMALIVLSEEPRAAIDSALGGHVHRADGGSRLAQRAVRQTEGVGVDREIGGLYRKPKIVILEPLLGVRVGRHSALALADGLPAIGALIEAEYDMAEGLLQVGPHRQRKCEGRRRDRRQAGRRAHRTQ